MADDETPPPTSRDESPWRRRRRLAAVFGDVLPETTQDEREPEPVLMSAGAGGGFRMKAASGTISAVTSTPKPNMVWRQPKVAMARSNSDGQAAPATY